MAGASAWLPGLRVAGAEAGSRGTHPGQKEVNSSGSALLTLAALHLQEPPKAKAILPLAPSLCTCALHSPDPLQDLCTYPALCLGPWFLSALPLPLSPSPQHPPPSSSSPYPPLILAAPLFVICPPPSPAPACTGQEGRQGETWSALCTHCIPHPALLGMHSML